MESHHTPTFIRWVPDILTPALDRFYTHPREGNFEVVVDGDLIWSKKARGQGIPTTTADVRTLTTSN